MGKPDGLETVERADQDLVMNDRKAQEKRLLFEGSQVIVPFRVLSLDEGSFIHPVPFGRFLNHVEDMVVLDEGQRGFFGRRHIVSRAADVQC